MSLAIVNYSTIASASAHSHDSSGFHSLHVLINYDVHHDDDTALESETEGDVSPSTPEHGDNEFHTHSTPQFGPNDVVLSVLFSVQVEKMNKPEPDVSFAPHREQPPFKPPRINL